MKILYDHQAFTIQEYGGISRYYFELALHFQNIPDADLSSSLLFSNNEYIKGNGVISSWPFFKNLKFQKKIEVMQLINSVKSKIDYKLNDFDIFHPTYYDPYYVTSKIKQPIVITFHDLIHEKFKRYDRKTLADKKKVLGRADKIIAISQNSKNDLIEYYSIPENRIDVIYLASDFTSNTNDLMNSSNNENYILYVGGRNHYKNFTFFVKAIASLLVDNSNLYLYCVGGDTFKKDEYKLLKDLHIEAKVKFYTGTDTNLQVYYSNALAFFFPSQYEGFGIPLLEAMGCGCPIGASETSSFPEIAGDAALYFDPYCAESIFSVAERLVAEPIMRAELARKGLLRSQHFSWQETVRKTYNLYKSLL